MASPPPQSGGRTQSAQGLEAVLSPRSIAVIGASTDEASVGHRLMANILSHGFRGPVHPVHPRAKQVLDHPVFRTVLDIPEPIDLAVIAVPAAVVRQVVEECGKKGVKGLLVVTAGFREVGRQGAALEEDLGNLARRFGMRLVGPNCLGVINADPNVKLHAIFADSPADGGPVALMTQSGALGIALLDRAHRLGLGIGRFVSMGNKVDVSGNDLLMHWKGDPDVKVIAMHLESVGNPRNFVRIAHDVTTTKPILLVKGGRTPEGARAAGSHTGAMVETDFLVDAMVDQAGVVRVGTVEELFDAALALAHLPLPAGNRIGIVTNSGGPAILLADALPGGGLELATLTAKTLQACVARLPAGASIANPLDMLAGASPQLLATCLSDLLRDPNVDAVVAMVTPLTAEDRPWADAILQSRDHAGGKPLVAVLFGRDAGSAGFRQLVQAGIPTYTFPENAARALAAMHRVAELRGRHDEPASRQRRPLATHTARRNGAGWVSAEESLRALADIGLRHPEMRRCTTPEEATQAAAAIGFPVALKVEAEGLVHKTEAGAVRLGLTSSAQVLEEAAKACKRVEAAGFPPRAILVQQMAPEGTEIIVGGIRDAKFGPLVSVGLGGIYTEALRDVAVRLAPVSAPEAERMIASLRARAILQGARGEPAKDIAALRDLVVALGEFLADNPSVQEVEANPVRVLAAGKGLVALDARMRLSGG